MMKVANSMLKRGMTSVHPATLLCTTRQRNFATLVMSEQFEGKLSPNLASLLSAAKELNDSQVDVLVHGDGCEAQVEEVQKYPGIGKIIVANDPALQNPYGDVVSKLAQKLVTNGGYDKVVAASSGFGKDVMPRLGGLLDVQAVTDVIEIVDGGAKFKRPVYAGNAIATVSTSDSIKLLTVRPTNFEKTEQGEAGNGYPVENADVITEGVKGSWKQNMVSKSDMADLGSAKYVVSGGRGLKNGENFEMLYNFAEVLGSQNCAVGASRAAVDAGYVPNDM